MDFQNKIEVMFSMTSKWVRTKSLMLLESFLEAGHRLDCKHPTHQTLFFLKWPEFKKDFLVSVCMKHCPKTCFLCAADITTKHEEVYERQAGTTVVCNMEEGSILKT